VRTATIPLIALVAIAALGCSKKPAVVKGAQGGGITSGTTDPKPLVVPDSLKNAAYDYFGLGNHKLMTYTVKLNNAHVEGEGTQTVFLEKVEDGSATYVIQRTGELTQVGIETVRLDDKGVTMLDTSQGEIDGPALEMPADIQVGSEWTVDLTWNLGGKKIVSKTKNTVVGIEAVETPAGKLDCLVVKVDLTGDITGSTVKQENGRYTTKSTMYWSKGVGLVKLEATTRLPNGDNNSQYIRLKSIGQ
jgi:hypothetical protein